VFNLPSFHKFSKWKSYDNFYPQHVECDYFLWPSTLGMTVCSSYIFEKTLCLKSQQESIFPQISFSTLELEF